MKYLKYQYFKIKFDFEVSSGTVFFFFFFFFLKIRYSD